MHQFQREMEAKPQIWIEITIPPNQPERVQYPGDALNRTDKKRIGDQKEGEMDRVRSEIEIEAERASNWGEQKKNKDGGNGES